MLKDILLSCNLSFTDRKTKRPKMFPETENRYMKKTDSCSENRCMKKADRCSEKLKNHTHGTLLMFNRPQEGKDV